MSARRRHQSDAVDRLVRAHLDREAGRVDASRLVARLREGIDPRPATALDAAPKAWWGHRWSRPVGWASAAAALVVAAFLVGRSASPTPANAAAILRDVKDRHAQDIDRCYRVHYAPDPRSWDGSNAIFGPSESILWTRGDRFWADCTIGPFRLSIGCSEDDTLWISPSPSQGIRFGDDPARLPTEVAVLCAINAMTVPTLVDEVLADFDLSAEGPRPGDPEATSLVWARLRAGRSHPVVSSALLEVDARSDTLRRLVVWLVRDGRPNGTVSYTLIDDATLPDARYRLESHLEPGATVEAQRLGPPATGATATRPASASDPKEDRE